MSNPKSNPKLNPLSEPFIPSPKTPTTPVDETRAKALQKKSTKDSTLPRLLSDREYRELLEDKEAKREERKIRYADAKNVRYAAAVERWAGFDDEDFMPQGLPES